MSQLAINVVGDELEEAADFCRSEDLGLEVTHFAFTDNLDRDLRESIERHKRVVTGIKPLISHAPFLDLITTSRDKEIINICRRRHSEALHASFEIGAQFYIAHTNFNQLIKEGLYRKMFAERTLDFWLPLVDEAAERNVIITLENIWDPYPDIQAEIVTKANHPNLRVSFDNGHALVFSDIPAQKWIETFGSMLVHCHLHDNSGESDEHKPIGDGKENWPDLIAALRQRSPGAIMVAESDSLKNNKISIERLRKM
ncbi:MAG: sugar phosphate isomerase/epimerase [candidate division Zixibacteria bacterium]|nr:sugar phosphate isomerase/epimerase [candidate division Zixibacteria bacterium]NIR67965.1 sugar phosphate isomerase/epimerase [candidate division Zixibacteria bacterium]NIS17465.1 sugar phosphate isomerase/epimerase [candidate division Zixibacteria bacterium]NIS49180.1 sugar phosphate isomerase/epimerase [candidate division Zixibacteria bacterium]NIT53784.1 sugar phosphate isomerase/epimerase [candidate division Zixibacteria bacterium]